MVPAAKTIVPLRLGPCLLSAAKTETLRNHWCSQEPTYRVAKNRLTATNLFPASSSKSAVPVGYF
jgi:hypothetical protein